MFRDFFCHVVPIPKTAKMTAWRITSVMLDCAQGFLDRHLSMKSEMPAGQGQRMTREILKIWHAAGLNAPVSKKIAP